MIRFNLRDPWWPIAAWIIFLFFLEITGMRRIIALATSFSVAIALAAYLRLRLEEKGKRSTRGWTIIAAFGAIFIWNGIATIIDASHHHGAGVVTYGDGDRYPEIEKVVRETTYKRHKYVDGAIMLGLGGLAICLLPIYTKESVEQD